MHQIATPALSVSLLCALRGCRLWPCFLTRWCSHSLLLITNVALMDGLWVAVLLFKARGQGTNCFNQIFAFQWSADSGVGNSFWEICGPFHQDAYKEIKLNRIEFSSLVWPSTTVSHVDPWENEVHTPVADCGSLTRAVRKMYKNLILKKFDSISSIYTSINSSPSLYIYMGTIAFED